MKKNKTLAFFLVISLLLTQFWFSGTNFAVVAAKSNATRQEQTTNQAPVANPQEVTTVHDQRVDITLTGSDPDGNPLQFNITSDPVNGTLAGSIPDMIYIPNTGFVGQDAFTFIVFDGIVESAAATVTINVINNAPIANALAISTSVGQRVDFTLTGTDPDEDDLQFNITSNPGNGILGGILPDMSYTPNAGFTGQDSFTFTVSDGIVTSLSATVTINVIPTGPVTVFEDNFEASTGWVRNPNGTDSARRGLWEIADPESVWYSGWKQLGNTVSGNKDLVTGSRAGWLPGDNDVDYGKTSMQSPAITLPAGKTITLSLYYYLAHASNSSNTDYLKIMVVGEQTSTVFQVVGRNRDVDAAWKALTLDLSAFAGQQINILIEAADLGYQSLVEAAIDDVLIIAQ